MLSLSLASIFTTATKATERIRHLPRSPFKSEERNEDNKKLVIDEETCTGDIGNM
jgi:hypothetical protein